MKILKKTGIFLLIAVCVFVLAYLGYFALRIFMPLQAQTPVLEEESLFAEKEKPVDKEKPEEPVVEEPVPEQPQEEVPTTMTAQDKAMAYLQNMTTEEKLWQLFYVTPEALTGVDAATQAGQTTEQALARMPVGGICYFGKNLEDPEQVTSMLAATKQYAKTPLFIGVDEEGGSVSRLGSNENMGVTWLDSAATYGQADDPQAVFDQASALAGQMLSLGFNMNFAPVADLHMEGNEIIGDRAYSSDPAVVGRLSGAMVDAMQSNGITACLKHFPGHGSAMEDTHLGVSYSSRTLDQLREDEFPAFRAGIDKGVHFVMMAHLTNENFSTHPASLSPEVVGLLRNELEFDGVIITDAMNMSAITGTYGADEAAVMAIQAGCDMILMPNSLEKAYEGLEHAVLNDTLTIERIDESVLRILTAKYEMGIMQ